jgi:hypothetical protein
MSECFLFLKFNPDSESRIIHDPWSLRVNNNDREWGYFSKCFSKCIGSVVAVAFQNVFRAEMHQNNIFFIFKKLFLRSAHQNDPKHTKKIKF